MKVFIDPGHGGSDSGAVDGTANDSISSREASLALDLSLKLGAALKRCGIDVMYSRTTDVYPTLQQRAAMANQWGADIFVAPHFNAYTDGSLARGIEVLYYPTSVKGKALAQAVYDAIAPISPWDDRGLKPRDNLYVLHATWMPAIIPEFGFITNTQEEEFISREVNRLAYAEGTARGICKYLGVPYVGTEPAPTVAVTVYRYRRDDIGDHVYGTSPTPPKGYLLDGPAWPQGVGNTIPVWQSYNSKTGRHFYSTDKNEGPRNGYTHEGAVFFVANSGTPIYRSVKAGPKHLWSADPNEGPRNGFTPEGPAWWVK